jgi:intein/homing endonuclease
MYINTELLKTEANHFIKYGYYCADPVGTPAYYEYWNEQLRRCKKGYSVGGLRITGNHYAYLNFAKILLTKEENKNEKVTKKKVRTGVKKMAFPDFWDGDYDYFWVIEVARNGIEKSAYEKLNLETNIIDLDGGKHIILAKARRKGYSYKGGLLAANQYNTVRENTTLIGAYEAKYLYPEGTMSMARNYLDFMDENTAWTKRRLIDRQDYVKSGYEQYVNGVKVQKGYKSSIIATTFKDNPHAARGKSASMVLLDEVGQFYNLKETYAAIRPTVESGNITTGQIILFGCVCAGTKVWTADGKMINVEDIDKSDGIQGYDTNSTFTEEIDWIKPPSSKLCYKITTKQGSEIECSFDHPILWSKNGMSYNKRISRKGKRISVNNTKSARYKNTEDIQIGEQIAVINSIPIFGEEEMWEARLVGMLIGDGSYGHNKTPRLSNCDKEINDYIDFKYDTVIERSNTTKDGKLYRETRIKGICKNLRELGIYGQVKLNKTLPKNLEMYNKESLGKLLAGLFDTDGHFSDISIILTSISKSLLEEVRFLSLKFGIHGHIMEIKINKEKQKDRRIKDKNNYFRFIVSDYASVVNFYKNIPIIVGYKIKALKELVNKNSNSTENTEILYTEKTKENKNYVNTTDLKGIRFETVKSIDFIGEKPIYNLTTSKTHTYIANGIITHNTGGDMTGGTIDFESMFYDPETYGLIAFENIWDEDGATQNCGWFFPDYKNKDGFMDKNGNSNVEAAKQYEESRREFIRKNSKDPQAIDMYIVERPFNPKEAFMQVSSNIFPVADLQKWRNRLLTTGLSKNIAVHGNLLKVDGEVKFKPSESVRPIVDFPPKNTSDLTGCVTVYQTPYRDASGKAPSGLYIVCCDPYAHDKSTGVSIGATYVIKRMNNFSQPDDMIVASYVGRPASQDQYNDILFMLAEYYNAKIGFENDRGNIIDYAKYHRKLNWLNEEFEIVDKTSNIRFGKLGRKFGISMSTKDRKGQAAIYLRDWLLTKRGKDETGEYSYNFNFIYDIALLDELIKYNYDGNFDRVSALYIGMYYLKELYRKDEELVLEEEFSGGLFDRDLF